MSVIPFPPPVLSRVALIFLTAIKKPPTVSSKPAATSILSTPLQSPVRKASTTSAKFRTSKVIPVSRSPPPSNAVLLVRRPMPLRKIPIFLIRFVALSKLISLLTISEMLDTIPLRPEMTRETPASFTFPRAKNATPSPSAKPLINCVTFVRLGPLSKMSSMASLILSQLSKNRPRPAIVKVILYNRF